MCPCSFFIVLTFSANFLIMYLTWHAGTHYFLTFLRCATSYTGKLRYVKLAYLENTTCVEVIVHSRTFHLYFNVFRPCLCRTRLWRKLGCIEVIFHSHEKFSISFTTGCVEVKMCTIIGLLTQKHNLVIIPIRR